MKSKRITFDIPIPGPDGKTIVRYKAVEVDADWNDDIQDYVLKWEARRKIERAKAREMGVLLPEDLKALRKRLGLTQKDMCELLRIGAKTWSRWENERERPSHSMNVLLRALNDGKIDVPYLKSLQEKPSWSKILEFDGWRSHRSPALLTVPTECGDPCCNDGEQTLSRAS